MPKIKYIAAGFVEDAEKVLGEFLKENSADFSDFAHIWRKHNFAAIYLGRSKKELEQFTQEIFQLTLKFLETTDLFRQIGAVYLLYSLFRSQLIDPPIRIRITLKQHERFLEFIKIAAKERYKTLYYVVSYLLERDGFDYVAHATLVGPRNSKNTMETESPSLEIRSTLKDIKDHLFDSSLLKELEELTTKYAELIKDKPYVDKELTPDLDLKSYINRLRLLHKSVCSDIDNSSANSLSDKEQDNIGSRRSRIKSKAFTSKALFRQLNPSDEDEEEVNEGATCSRSERELFSRRAELPKESEKDTTDKESNEKGAKSKKRRRRRRPRVPKSQRQLGRPKKGLDKELEKLLMDIEDAPESSKFRGVKKRGPTARNSCLDEYVEEAFKAPVEEMALLSFSSEEENDDDNVDDPDFCPREAAALDSA